ncbi:MAG TPA: transcriptional regulator [Syntrophomonas sp.]|jgi:DNA-binding transcriptional ArsR family regulator|nr:transcriptional regulator [Syntrophomonas sp.]
MADFDRFDRCEVTCIHEEAVSAVRQVMISDDVAQSLADIFKTLADSTRVKMLFALMHRELCVCDLAAVIRASESSVSHQLRILRTNKLVKFRRDGKILYYSLADDHVKTLFKQGLEHASHDEAWAAQFLDFIK